MLLKFGGHFEMSWRTMHGVGDNALTMADDFVNDAVGFLKSQRQRRESETARMQQEQQAKDARGPGFWSDVRNKVRKLCGEIEVEMDEQLFSWPEGISQHELRVSGNIVDAVRTLSARHDEKTHLITYSVNGENGGSFSPYMAGTQVGYLDGSEPVSAEQAAQKMVKALIGRRV